MNKLSISQTNVRQAILRACLLGIMLLLLVACNTASDPNVFARQWLNNNGHTGVKVTKTVSGNPKNQKADELWCIKTDGLNSVGRPLFLAVWQIGGTWSGAQMADDEYDWDLYGCTQN